MDSKRTHNCYCVQCQQKRPYSGFDMARRICGRCQGRPSKQTVLAIVERHYERIPRKVLAILMAL